MGNTITVENGAALELGGSSGLGLPSSAPGDDLVLNGTGDLALGDSAPWTSSRINSGTNTNPAWPDQSAVSASDTFGPAMSPSTLLSWSISAAPWVTCTKTR